MKCRVFTVHSVGYQQYHNQCGTALTVRTPCRVGTQDDCLPNIVRVRMGDGNVIDLPEGCVTFLRTP